MISEMALKMWRRQALNADRHRMNTINLYKGASAGLVEAYIECQVRILKLTQELLDPASYEEIKMSDEIIAKLDKGSTGKHKRYTIGTVDSPIGGAVYVKPEVELPVTITVVIPGREKDVPNN